jgi:hypothetical protein
MLAASLITLLSSLLLVNAQNAQLETESIEEQFHNSFLVPDLISTFGPLGFLSVSFGADAATAGSPLTVDGTFLDSIARLGVCALPRSRFAASCISRQHNAITLINLSWM